ncbi:MAG TPA: hypothetical protein VEY12_05205 [Thermoplasmata archaeon]|nr:hypothetical protein [Thermoplasmata archaeon]
MNRKMLTLLAVPLVAVALAISAAAIVPGLQKTLAQGPLATSVAAPAWAVGDRWTYNVSMAALAEADVLPREMIPDPTMPAEAFFAGALTETVAGSVSTEYGAAWNVTLDGRFGSGIPRPIIMSAPTVQAASTPGVTLTGFLWLRQSDLAPVYTLKTVHLDRNWTVPPVLTGAYGMEANATYRLTCDATTQVWYRPALGLWSFPLRENATWNASTNATIRYASTFRVVGPNVTYEAAHFANFTVPVRFSLRAGVFETVTTPAGAFRALPVSPVQASLQAAVPDRDASAVMNLTGDADVEMPHAFATAWFSATAGNVVKATFWSGPFVGPRLEMDLVSYTYT